MVPILQIAFWLETCRSALNCAMKRNTWHMWMPINSGLCEYARPLSVWWSFTSGTSQPCLCYVHQTGLRVIWQRWHTCRTGIHTHTHSVGYQHTLQREKHGRGKCQGTCLISSRLFIYHFLFCSLSSFTLTRLICGSVTIFHSNGLRLTLSSTFTSARKIYNLPTMIYFFPNSEMSVSLVFYYWRPTSPCCRESCSTAPGWPSRLQLSIWPSMSSFSWMPMPARRLIPLRLCWRWMSTARGGLLTGTSSALKL